MSKGYEKGKISLTSFNLAGVMLGKPFENKKIIVGYNFG